MRFVDTTGPDLTDGWSNTVENSLYVHARGHTPTR
jgi:hypothetical protein